ncbi:hypothetical protein [Antrihabitans sp. YC2-6]|uniref:hypothetical protein n=1 Tax=Antrihabitans sp. YC2-6 TaxID=2799498 RepID=UPI0018F5F655|nr:hypothetical protein [Antrihabitans sp. YC2-6]MBJ8343369.1 hypothetical protein [Antrihabitans sp. YC2-6]
MRKSVVLGAIAASAAALLLPTATANADTTVTISVAAGNLNISDPAAATLTLSGANYSGSIGDVLVTDDRGNLLATWTAKAAMTAFTNASDSVAASNTTYTPGLATPVSGLGLVTLPALVPPAMSSTPATVMSLTAGVGKNKVKWNPTLTTPANLYNVSQGSYTATLTHSVA